MNRVLIFAVALAAVAGCSDRNGKKAEVEKKEKVDGYAALSADAVLVKVGTNMYTKGDVERLIDLRVKMLTMTLPKTDGQGGINRTAVQAQVLSSVPTSYRSQIAQFKWAETNGIALTQADICHFQTNFMRACGVQGEEFARFKRRFSASEQKTIDERIRAEAIFMKVNARHLELYPSEPTEKMVSDFIAGIDRYNKAAVATNALVWARGTNLWERLNKGERLEDLASEHSEEGSFDGEAMWGAFRLDELKDSPALVKILPTLNVGDLTPPIEADNGLCIIRLDEITDAAGNGTARHDPFSRYHLSRIYLRLPEIYERPTQAEAVEALREGLRKRSFVARIRELIARDGATFPSGEKIFEEAREMRKMPMMLQQVDSAPRIERREKDKEDQ